MKESTIKSHRVKVGVLGDESAFERETDNLTLEDKKLWQFGER